MQISNYNKSPYDLFLNFQDLLLGGFTVAERNKQLKIYDFNFQEPISCKKKHLFT